MVRISDVLPRAVGADDGDDRAFGDLKRHTIERLRIAVKRIEIVDRQHQPTISVPRYDFITAGSRTTAARFALGNHRTVVKHQHTLCQRHHRPHHMFDQEESSIRND